MTFFTTVTYEAFFEDLELNRKWDSAKHFTHIAKSFAKNGCYHLVSDDMLDGYYLPNCQSYNLDRPNYLDKYTMFSTRVLNEETLATLKLCKKCFKGILILK